MHLQQDWSQLYFEHHAVISCMDLELPQKQVGHFPEGQFPPHESERAKTPKSIEISTPFI